MSIYGTPDRSRSHALTLTLSQRARELRCRGGEQLWRIAVKNASRGRENEGEFGELVGGGSAPAAKSGPGHQVCAHMSIYGDGRDSLAHASGLPCVYGAEVSIYGELPRTMRRARLVTIVSAWRCFLSLSRPGRPFGTAGPPRGNKFSAEVSIYGAAGGTLARASG